MLKIVLLSVIFILGYTNLSYELIILRELVNFLGSNILITSIIMAFILLFLSVGYYLGSVIPFKRYAVRRMNTYLVFGLGLWYLSFCSYDMMLLFFSLVDKGMSPLLQTFFFSCLWLVFPAIATGFITASIGRFIHFLNKNYTGRFMAIDTLGSVLGSLLTTLVFMPLLGVSVTIFVLVTLTLFSSVIYIRKKDRVLGMTLFVLCVLASCFINIVLPSQMAPYVIKDDAISRVEIVPDEKEQSLLMRMNGSFSSKISSNRENMFAYIQFINSFIKSLPTGKKYKILVLGAGGFTVGLDDNNNEYTFLDIEPKLKEISEKLFLRQKLGENKKFIVQDGYFFMLKNKDKYDVIILDIYSSKRSIPMNFVTRDFLTMVKGSLNEDGYLIANIITSPFFANGFSRRIDNTFRVVFPQNLSRQIINPFLLSEDQLANVLYIYRHLPIDTHIYTLDKNTAMYGQY